MALKRFDEFARSYSKDPNTFKGQVAIVCNEELASDLFKKVSAPAHSLPKGMPILVWDEAPLPTNVNESFSLINKRSLPSQDELYEELNGKAFVPKTVKRRDEVKGLKFPIIGISETRRDEFKTLGKWKKSEERYGRFREAIRPGTVFEAIYHKNEPIHLMTEKGGLDFDVDLNQFKHAAALSEIGECLNSKYSPGFYRARLVESNGNIFLDSVGSTGRLTPSQLVSIYNEAYESHYGSRLPNWFKRDVFESVVVPHYTKRRLDAALIKPEYAKDLSKYVGE